MKIVISENPEALGGAAAKEAAECLNAAVAANGSARIVLSTGASQFDTITALIAQNIDWTKVEMFHLDEYAGLPITHIASFRKYLQERFVSKVNLMGAYFVDGTAENIAALTAKLAEKEVDLGLIGIGENAHIAFNDPPADFETRESYIFVNLDDDCKRQQVREGWFAAIDDVPEQAVSMTPHRIMQCKKIISCVPYSAKADAVYKTLMSEVSPVVPATLLKTHPDWSLYIDKDSAGRVVVV